MEENFSSFEYSGNLYLTVDTNGSDDEQRWIQDCCNIQDGALSDEEDNDYQTITHEKEDVEEEIDELEQIDLEIDKNLDITIVIDIVCIVSLVLKNILLK